MVASPIRLKTTDVNHGVNGCDTNGRCIHNKHDEVNDDEYDKSANE